MGEQHTISLVGIYGEVAKRLVIWPPGTLANSLSNCPTNRSLCHTGFTVGSLFPAANSVKAWMI